MSNWHRYLKDCSVMVYCLSAYPSTISDGPSQWQSALEAIERMCRVRDIEEQRCRFVFLETKADLRNEAMT